MAILNRNPSVDPQHVKQNMKFRRLGHDVVPCLQHKYNDSRDTEAAIATRGMHTYCSMVLPTSAADQTMPMMASKVRFPLAVVFQTLGSVDLHDLANQ